MRNGAPVKGAGDSTVEVEFTPPDARCNLPGIYFLLGQQVIQSVR
jgi:hypothetical protein